MASASLTDMAAKEVRTGDALRAKDVVFYVVSAHRLSGPAYQIRLTGSIPGVGIATVYLADDTKVAVER